MKNSYLLLLALLLGATIARAQTLDYPTSLALAQAGAYTDLGATSTVIATANTDDANSAAQDIGFPFTYDGTTYTQFVLNTNGFIKLGAVAPPAATFLPYAQSGEGVPLVSNANLTDLILPFNTDLTSSTTATAEYRMAVTGTAPNRVCTVQWKNVADKPRPATSGTATLVPAQLASFSFQLKLYETTRRIAFVYGPATASSAPSTYISSVAGLRGAGVAASSGQLVLVQKNSGVAWSTVNFVDAPYTGTIGFNVRNTVLPDAGQTYTFIAPVANDATVAEIHALGTALVPGAPLSIDVVVRNTGTAALTSVPVTLAISGANTVTLPAQASGALAAGASTTLTFSGISLTAAGANTLRASVPADGNTTNDVLTQPLAGSASNISYVVGGQGATGGGYGYNPGYTGAFLARFTLSGPRTITGVQAYLTDFPITSTQTTTVGQTVYGVVLSATNGAVLARSPNFVVTSNAVFTNYTFTLSAPLTLPAGDFLAGLAQVAPAGSLPFYPMGVQVEVPTRADLFYSIDELQTTAAPVAYPPSFGNRLMLGVITRDVLATAPARTLALSVYPNPSATGNFTLDLSGVSTPGEVRVEVNNLLGQRLYSGTARADARSPLPLAGLAPGLYTLRISNGREYGQQQLCIAP